MASRHRQPPADHRRPAKRGCGKCGRRITQPHIEPPEPYERSTMNRLKNSKANRFSLRVAQDAAVRMSFRWCLALQTAMLGLGLATGPYLRAEDLPLEELDRAYTSDIRPVLRRYCEECHSEERTEAEINLVDWS